MRRCALVISALALLFAGCKYCLAPLAIFGGPEKPLVTPADAGYQNENWWPDSGRSTVEDVTEVDAGSSAAPDPCLDAFPPCSDYALAVKSVEGPEVVLGIYMPVKVGTDLSTMPGSRLFDGGCVPGTQHAWNGSVRFERDCSSLVVNCKACSK